MGDLSVLSQVAATRAAFEHLTKGLEAGEAGGAAEVAGRSFPGFQLFCDAYGYENVYLFDVRGRLIYRLKSDIDVGDGLATGPLKDSELADAFRRAKLLLQAVFTD